MSVHSDLLEDWSVPGYAEGPLVLSGDTFAEHWPTLAAAAQRSLLSRGVPLSSAEDALQEAALRAFGRTFHSPTHARRWSTRVAHNLAIDAHRGSSRIELGDVPETEEAVGTADAVLARIELSRVTSAIMGLSVQDQAVLRAAAESKTITGTKRERDRVALRLFRARKRLLEVLKAAIGVGGLAETLRRKPFVAAAMSAAAVAALTFTPLVSRGHVDVGAVPHTMKATAVSRVVSSALGETTLVAVPRPSPAAGNEEIAPAGQVALAPNRINTELDLPSPTGGNLARIDTPEREERAPLLCVRNFPVVGEYCSPMPPPPPDAF